MKAYLITTGTVFGLIVIAHLWRIAEEGMHHAPDTWAPEHLRWTPEAVLRE